MPPGYTDTASPVREPSGVNNQEFDTCAQDFPTPPTNLGCRDGAVSELSSDETGSDQSRFSRTETAPPRGSTRP